MIALAFRDVLEDCLSYLEWLKVQEDGSCDISTFHNIIEDNDPLVQQTNDYLGMVMMDLFVIKTQDDTIRENIDELMATFAADIQAEYELALEAGEVDLFDSDIEVPVPPLACPLDTFEHYNETVTFVSGYESL